MSTTPPNTHTPSDQPGASHPASAKPQALRSALARYRVMAYVTGVLLAFMFVVALPYRYLVLGADADPPLWYTAGWMLHGYVYIVYVAVSLDLVFRLRWGLLRALGVVLAGTIPFMSFVAESKVRRAVEEIIASRTTAADVPH